MQEFAVILMLKDAESGVIERELCSIPVTANGGLLRNIYAVQNNGEIFVHMLVTTDRDVTDWEFQAIYDYYDEGIYEGLGLEVRESEGDDNPVWDIIFAYFSGEAAMSAKVSGILNLHRRELEDVYETITGLEGDYNAL